MNKWTDMKGNSGDISCNSRVLCQALESSHPSLIFLNLDMLGGYKRKASSCADTPRSCRAYLRMATHERILIKY